MSACLGGAAIAQEVELILPDLEEMEDLRETLQNASLLFALESADIPESGPPSAEDYVAAARADYRRLLTGLYAEGRYSGVISIEVDGREASGIQPLEAPSSVERITITVSPGPEFIFGQAEVMPLAPGTELPESFAPGEPAYSGAVADAVDAAVEAWREIGHAKAEPGEQDITAIHPEQRLDASVAIQPGPELTFGDLVVSGNEDVRTDRIVAIANLPEGRTFTPDVLTRATRRLQQSGAFSTVAVREAETYNADGTLDVIVELVEAPPRRLSFGAEVSSVEGVALSASWLHRNLLGGAESLELAAEINGLAGDADDIDYILRATFDRQATFRRDTDFTGEVVLQRLQEPGYTLDAFSIETGLTRAVFLEDLIFTAGPGYTYAREETDFRTREYQLLTLPLGAELDRRDDPQNATEGFYIDLEVTPFYGLSGIGSGARTYADARVYRGFGERVVVALRGQAGAVFGVGPEDAPADYLFYSGGGGTVRGQPYQSLDVEITRDFGEGPTTVETGGALFLGLQSEARVAVTEKIGAVAFVDAGLVGPDPFDPSVNEWHAGAGLGVRYNTLIGPIRLDVATPVTGDDTFGSVDVYVGIGQSF
ncbi:autotransporter assembly complex protein TamA [Pseudoroseicyclus tamaricis]|uniref:BamA/TamA family outer membrane protein n=1 Tax=Pseudoroseicyclus tamaricis TaxID=2705421 RepID=A0A6B2JXC2_9RHOB|nr:BamA/TamA family outer membrane protein [Pseudoroseicyclus tamaricis]NDU99991.1 BamA/TamA family outer membrane protein [Pseudoroseicyclus tamaricis]